MAKKSEVMVVEQFKETNTKTKIKNTATENLKIVGGILGAPLTGGLSLIATGMALSDAKHRKSLQVRKAQIDASKAAQEATTSKRSKKAVVSKSKSSKTATTKTTAKAKAAPKTTKSNR